MSTVTCSFIVNCYPETAAVIAGLDSASKDALETVLGDYDFDAAGMSKLSLAVAKGDASPLALGPWSMCYLAIEQAAAAAKVAAAEARAAAAEKGSFGKITFKVSKRGAVSIYGLGRWPITLYRKQWERLLEAIPELKAFIAENMAALSTGKDDPRFANVKDED